MERYDHLKVQLFLLCRPSTPISELLQYKYSQKWLEEQQAKDRALLEHQSMKVISWHISSGGWYTMTETVTCTSCHTSWTFPHLFYCCDLRNLYNISHHTEVIASQTNPLFTQAEELFRRTGLSQRKGYYDIIWFIKLYIYSVVSFSQRQLAKTHDTRTTLLRKSRPLEEPPSTWKLPRFQKVRHLTLSFSSAQPFPSLSSNSRFIWLYNYYCISDIAKLRGVCISDISDSLDKP